MHHLVDREKLFFLRIKAFKINSLKGDRVREEALKKADTDND